MIYTLELLYRDACNYKTFLTQKVDSDIYPTVKLLSIDDVIEMGQFGIPSQDDFFNSEIHPHLFSFKDDHNLLDIEGISVTDAEGNTTALNKRSSAPVSLLATKLDYCA